MVAKTPAGCYSGLPAGPALLTFAQAGPRVRQGVLCPGKTFRAVAEEDITVGRVMPLREGLEPYPGCRLSQFLGRGAWGEVWKAAMPDGPEAALKFLPCESTAATTQELRALQGIRQLRH